MAESMKTIQVCTTCGSPRVFADAYAALNTDEVRTYQQEFCDDCEGECSTAEVQVQDDFDLDTDFVTLESAKPRNAMPEDVYGDADFFGMGAK